MATKEIRETTIESSENFDENKLTFGNHEIEKYVVGGMPIENHGCTAYYMADGVKTRLVIFAPEQSIFGFNYVYDLKDSGKKDSDGKPVSKEPKGVQISYPMTSKNTVSSPTEEEANIEFILHSIWLRAITHVSKFSDVELNLLPGVTSNAIKIAKWESTQLEKDDDKKK